MSDEELLALARETAAAAYAPYSGFRVGAVVLARDGRTVVGVNVENASYPLGVCAERAALARAAVEGVRPGDVEAVAVTASPCGGCRQWLLEFGADRVVFEHEGAVVTRAPAALLPDSFSL